MKRRIILSIALTLSVVLVLLTNSDSRVAAENPERFIADSGIISLGSNQVLTVTAAGFDPGPLDGKFISFREIKYSPEAGCSGIVCKLIISSQTTSAPVSLRTGEAASFTVGPDIHGNQVRIVLLSNSRDAQLSFLISDPVSGKTSVYHNIEWNK
ncbi:MAG TPA: hypothetical protein VNB22_14395 [Pyrinomonadaceae bacterium]|jgi:hypothetical protein|nr:hypothetical protein [Pyrinomonadaceae bacterium]